MTTIEADGESLLLYYCPYGNQLWPWRNLKNSEEVRLKSGTFSFLEKHLHSPMDLSKSYEQMAEEIGDDEIEYVFTLGKRDGEYFKIDQSVVQTENAFFFHENIVFSDSLFVAEKGISILQKIDALVSEDVFIGGEHDSAIPDTAYQSLLKRFPNYYELVRYSNARVGACLEEYLGTPTEAEKRYHKLMEKRNAKAKFEPKLDFLQENELLKFESMLMRINSMLASEESYYEDKWQSEILEIFLLLYPKYISVLENATIRDVRTGKRRELDLMLVDSRGCIDIVEIKQPFDRCLVSERKYRENHIPLRELSGTIMQIEKYILYLNSWGLKGEEVLTRRYRKQLPDEMELKIINPSGIIVMGREDDLTEEQKDDFEVVKRKYKNVIDILSYDDLVARLKVTIAQLKSRISMATAKENE